MKLELEAAECEKQRQLELKAKEIEHEAQKQHSASETSIANSNINYNGMKSLKLHTFNENSDDLDAYLNRSERTCRSFDIPVEQWSIQLARLLQGTALEVFSVCLITKSEIIKHLSKVF